MLLYGLGPGLSRSTGPAQEESQGRLAADGGAPEHASGIIDNGGFHYLFEGNFNGDPYFAKTAAAYKTIKAAKCAEAVEEALKLFPDSKPPTDIGTRLKVYQSVSAAQRQAIDRKFFSENKEIKTILAKYIRENRDEFKHLK